MKPSAYISDGGILFKESPPDSILKLNPLYTSAEIQALHAEIEALKLFKEQMKTRKAMVKWLTEESD